MPIDPYSQLAFVEILNILLTAGHIVDVNRFLISRNVNPQFGSLSGYFRWSFAGDHFTLWQRTDYNSTLCFNHRILDLPFGVLAAKDSGKDKETAKSLSERFGKILQQRQSISINRQDTSTSINTQLDSLIPASKIANLSQGTFVGSVADNFGEEIDQKIFHARIIVDSAKVSEEMKAYKKIPVINEFRDADGNDIMQQQIDRNYSQIKADVLQIIEEEMERIKNDPELRYLIPQQEGEENND